MAPKRKSDVIDDLLPPVAVLVDSDSSKENKAVEVAPIFKKARVAGASEASTSKGKAKPTKENAPKTWKDVKLEGEDEASSTASSFALILTSLSREIFLSCMPRI
jgi:hypothetical protein